MTVTNNLVKQIDMPVWEWCRFAPEASAAALCMCASELDAAEHIYYQGATNLWRYSTIADSWQRCAGPQIAPLAVGAMRFSSYGGYRGNILAATNSTFTLAGLAGNKLVGKTVRIVSGTGAGQEREITAITHQVVEYGNASAAAAASITDNQTIPKKWLINQWVGYQCRIVMGTGDTQTRKIIYNNTNTLYFNNPDLQPYFHWDNTPFSAIAPNVAPAAGCKYSIEKSVATIDTNWTTNPDSSSRFVIMTGACWYYTGRTLANGSAAIQYYDVITDTWLIKTCPGTIQNVAAVTDASIERTGEIGGSFYDGTCSSSCTARSIVVAAPAWVNDQYTNFRVRVLNPATGVIQSRRIIGNTSIHLFVEKPFDTTPDNTYTFEIYGDTNAIWMIGNSRAGISKYLVDEDLWVPSHEYDTGVCSNLSIQKSGTLPFGYTATVNTAAILTVNPVPTVAGTGYKVGNILNVTQSANAKVRVTSISAGGVVTGIELYAGGTGTATTGTGKATTALLPATGGTGCTIEITSVGNLARVTTTLPHNFVTGDTVSTKGATVAGWNSSFTLLHVDTSTTCEFAPPNATAPAASASQAVGLLVDPSKSWTAGEHIGKLIIKYTGVFPINTSEIRKITANTDTTITPASTWTLPVTGKDRYAICEMKAFGRDSQYHISAMESCGWATSGTSDSLTDTTKAWDINQWAGYKLKVICGTGYDKGEVAIASNTADTLTLTTPDFTPDTTTKYEIMDTWGIATGGFAATTLQDTTKNWVVNQWAGKQVRFTGGTLAGLEVTISSNTANTLTYATTTTLSDATCTYTILAAPIKGAGIQAVWNYGHDNVITGGRLLLLPRGGSTTALGSMTIDVYNITQDKCLINLDGNPQTEMQTLGTQWAYDGDKYLYITQTGSSSRIFRINMDTYEVESAGQPPYAHGTAVIGNRMEIITTEDGLKYLYLMRSTGAELWRVLLWY